MMEWKFEQLVKMFKIDGESLETVVLDQSREHIFESFVCLQFSKADLDRYFPPGDEANIFDIFRILDRGFGRAAERAISSEEPKQCMSVQQQLHF